MSDTTVSIPGATAQDPVAEGMQQSSAAGMDVPSSERDPPVPVVTTGSGVTVSNSVVADAVSPYETADAAGCEEGEEGMTSQELFDENDEVPSELLETASEKLAAAN